jgi:hypothetical protein
VSFAPARPSSFLLILGEREGLSWVLENRRMAFTRRGAQDARGLRKSDRLFIYTTRGCFHNPTRDRGRVIGEAEVTSSVSPLEEPVEIAGRTFSEACRIRIEALAPFGDGIELRDLLPMLKVLPQGAAWGMQMRRALLRLPDEDVSIIRRELAPKLRANRDAARTYLAMVKAPATARSR